MHAAFEDALKGGVFISDNSSCVKKFSQVATIALNVEDIPDSLGGFFLSCGGDMDVGVQGEACGKVTQHTAYRLDDHTVLGGQ